MHDAGGGEGAVWGDQGGGAGLNIAVQRENRREVERSIALLEEMSRREVDR